MPEILIPCQCRITFSFWLANSSAGDYRVTSDLVQFMRFFLKRFPVYKDRPFWVSGESYGGHYGGHLLLRLPSRQPNHLDCH